MQVHKIAGDKVHIKIMVLWSEQVVSESLVGNSWLGAKAGSPRLDYRCRSKKAHNIKEL